MEIIVVRRAFSFLINKWNQIIAFRGIDAEDRNGMEFFKKPGIYRA